jgi:hypothetical protein
MVFPTLRPYGLVRTYLDSVTSRRGAISHSGKMTSRDLARADGLQRENRRFAIRLEGSILRSGDVPGNGILQRLLRVREFLK